MTTQFLKMTNSKQFVSYHCLYEYPNEDNLKIHYKLTVSELADNSKKRILEINKGQVFVNETKPELFIHELADQLGKSFYPINLQTNSQGAISSIHNIGTVQQRCQETENNVRENYEGDEIEKMLFQFKKDYTNSNKILHTLQKDLAIQLFFMPLYLDYTNGEKHFTTKGWHKDKETTYVCTATLLATPSPSGKGIVQLKVTATTDASYLLEVTYKIDPNDKEIFSIIGKVQWDTKKQTETIIFEFYKQLELN